MFRRPVVFAISVALWIVYFYGVDWLIMSAQGLPVGLTLMPAS